VRPPANPEPDISVIGNSEGAGWVCAALNAIERVDMSRRRASDGNNLPYVSTARMLRFARRLARCGPREPP
jgi:hypothetical protein